MVNDYFFFFCQSTNVLQTWIKPLQGSKLQKNGSGFETQSGIPPQYKTFDFYRVSSWKPLSKNLGFRVSRKAENPVISHPVQAIPGNLWSTTITDYWLVYSKCGQKRLKVIVMLSSMFCHLKQLSVHLAVVMCSWDTES